MEEEPGAHTLTLHQELFNNILNDPITQDTTYSSSCPWAEGAEHCKQGQQL